MSMRKINFVEGEYYHIYNRGNSKQKIFHDKQDHKHFIDLLYILNNKNNVCVTDIKRYKTFDLFQVDQQDKLVSIGSYVLMPNHFHILITEKTKDGISKFMQKITTAYVMYYNKKYQRTGALFEGKFKSQHLNTDIYLKYIFSYIHLNPVKLIQKDWKEKGIKNKKEALVFLENYEFSSYADFIGISRKQQKIIDVLPFPEYFPKTKDFVAEIFSWLNYQKQL